MKYYIIKVKIKHLTGKTGTTHFNQRQNEILKPFIPIFFRSNVNAEINPNPWNITISVKLVFPLENFI